MNLASPIRPLPWLAAIPALWLAGAAAASSASGRAGSAIPFKPESAAGDPDGWRILASLVVCVLLLALILYLVRRYLPQAKGLLQPDGQRVKVLESRQLGSGNWLHVVRFGQREILIGQSQKGLVRLASRIPPDVATSDQAHDGAAEEKHE